MTNKELAKKLWRGAEKIERYGWTVGAYGDEERGYCILGACKATVISPEDHFLASFIAAQTTMAYWNDSVCSSKIEAISLLQAAAICAEEGI